MLRLRTDSKPPEPTPEAPLRRILGTGFERVKVDPAERLWWDEHGNLFPGERDWSAEPVGLTIVRLTTTRADDVRA